MVSKGLPLIYSLKHEHVDRKTRFQQPKEEITPIQQQDMLTKNLLLAGAKKAILEGYKVEVVEQQNLDGINA